MGSTQRDDTWSTLLQSVANTRDREAFQKLFEHFAPLVKGFCLSKPVAGQSSNLADEVVQEVMIKVWQKASSFDASKASASTWIFTLARNCRIDLIRRNKRHDNDPLTSDDLWASDEDAAPVTHLQKVRDAHLLQKACQELPPEQLQVIGKVFVEGKTHAETAEELDMRKNTDNKSKSRRKKKRKQNPA